MKISNSQDTKPVVAKTVTWKEETYSAAEVEALRLKVLDGQSMKIVSDEDRGSEEG